MELKKIPLDSKSFEANGKVYTLTDDISIERFTIFEKLEVDLAFRGGFQGVINTLYKIRDHLNKLEIYNAIVELANILDVFKKSDKDKYVPSINICSLFLNTKDEDVRWMSDELLDQKQKDFEQEGIPASFFLALASKLVPGYKEHLKKKE